MSHAFCLASLGALIISYTIVFLHVAERWGM